MYETTFALTLIIYILSGCKKHTGKDCPNDTYKFDFKTNAKVDTLTNPEGTFYATVKSGINIVFSYEKVHTECPEIADGIWGEKFFFEINPSLTSFKYNSDSLSAIKFYYNAFCIYGCNNSAYIPAEGVVEGKKISEDKWKIYVNVKINVTRQLIINEVFT